MDSLGAVYSRASSHIFGDWNACGKVMGLAPWQGHVWNSDDSKQLKPEILKDMIFKGAVYDGIQIDKSTMMKLPFISRTDSDMFDDNGNMVRSKRYDFDDDDFEEIDLGEDEEDKGVLSLGSGALSAA